MKAKALVVAAVVGLATVAALIGLLTVPPSKEAISSSRIEKAFLDVQGNPIIGVKDFSDQGEGWPEQHYYAAGPFAMTASPEDVATISALLRQSVALEYSAMLSSNTKASSEAIKEEYATIYSDAKGDRTKHRGFIDANKALLAQDGYMQKELNLTRFEVMGVEADGYQATAIVEEESLGVRTRVSDQPTPKTITVKNGRQIKFYLVREVGAWRILGESWAFLPGMEP